MLIAMTGLPGLTEMRSLNKPGLSIITLVFTDATNVYFARQMVMERLLEVGSRLPAGFQPVLGPVSSGLGEVFQLIQGFIDCYSVVVANVARVDGLDDKQAVNTLLEAVKAAVLAGDVKSVEAASKAVVENAVALVVERGVVARDGKVLKVVKDKEADRAALGRLLRFE